MKRAWSLLAWMGLACVGCSGSAVDGSAAAADVTSCEVGAPLAGAAYDITKSRFAFGSTPSEDDAYGFVRWVGVDGVVGIEQSGAELGILNAAAPEAQGDGLVILHHTSSSSTAPFAATATYDVEPPPGPLGLGSTLSFDADGNPVSNSW